MADHDDDAMSRLRASDPATGSHPDLHSLRRAIGAKAPASLGAGDTVTHLADDALGGPRLRTPWIAAAAVAALGIGIGGYALGAQSSDSDSLATGGQNKIATPASPGIAEDSAGAGSSGELTQGSAQASSDSGSGMSYDPGPVRLVAGPDLATTSSTGEVRALTSDVDPEIFLAQWQQQLKFEGTPISQGADESWFGADAIINPDTLQVLSAQREAGGPMHFNYEDMLNSPYCAEMYQAPSAQELAMIKEEWAKSVGPSIPFPDSTLCKEVSGPPPTEEAAIATAREFLSTTGLDFSGYDFTAMDYGEPGASELALEGRPADDLLGQLITSVTVGPQGVISASGSIGEMTSLGQYPLISPVEAVARYSQREFTMDYGVMIAEDMVAQEDMAATTSAAPDYAEPDYTMPKPVKVEPGMRIPLLLKEKTVTKAELVQGNIYTQSGTLEVPTWKLITPDGMHYVVMAIADESIDWQSWQ